MKLVKLIAVSLCVAALQACYEDEAAVGFDYQEGDVIAMVPKFNSQTDSVVFFLDTLKIGSEYEQPFVHYFKVTNSISSGKHSYSYITFYSSQNTRGTYNHSSSFTIK